MERRLNVVECIDNMGIGGTELNAVRTVERLPPERYHVRVVALNADGPVRERYDRLGVPVEVVQVGPLYSPRTISAIVRLASRLRSWQADVVHCHDRYTNFVGVLAGRLAGVPLVIASKRWGETTTRHRLTSAVAFRAAHRVVANGESTSDSLQHVDHVAKERITVIPNFVDDEMFQAPTADWLATHRASLRIPAGAPVGGIVASLRPVKDHATLLRALPTILEAFPTFVLVIVGDGPSRGELERLAAELGTAGAVRFAGILPQCPTAHHIFDVSFLTSRSEGFPNALVEAMAASKPIVGTDVTGVRDAVVHEQNGLLIPWGDSAALAAATVRLLGSAQERSRMGENGRRMAVERYSASGALAGVMSLYDSARRNEG